MHSINIIASTNNNAQQQAAVLTQGKLTTGRNKRQAAKPHQRNKCCSEVCGTHHHNWFCEWYCKVHFAVKFERSERF